MKVTKDWGLKVGVVLLAVFWLSLMAASWADAGEAKVKRADAEAEVRSAAHDSAARGGADFGGSRTPAGISDATAAEGTASGEQASRAPASAGNSGDDEYNFNWLDPEKKIYVLQNRRYLKADRLMLSLMGGTGFSNPYRSTYNLDGRAAFYLSESWGFEGFYTFTTNSANSTFNALAGTNFNILPVIREIRGQYGGLVHWVPWYAKINVFNKVLYFDWYFTAGAGLVHTALYNSSADGVAANIVKTEVIQDNFAMFFGTGHIYHITDSLLVRLDFTSAVYNAQIFGTGGGATWYTNLNFGAGVGLRL